jgi:small GTP-binding protein
MSETSTQQQSSDNNGSAPPIKYEYEILSEDYTNFDLSFKLIVIGDSGVGKSCLTNNAIKNVFDEAYNATVGFEFFTFNVKMCEKVIKLQIWDTCGQEIYRSLISSFYRSSSLAVIVYAIDRRQSFDEIDLWIKELKSNKSPDSKIILVGNKLDLAEYREIQYEEGEQKAKDNAFIDFFETSAKTGENISKMFIKVANILYEEHLNFKGIETDDQFQTFKPNKPNFKVVKKKGKKNKKECC